MKNLIMNLLAFIILISVPSCYSSHLIGSGDKLNEQSDIQIVSVELKDGRIIKNEPPVIIYNSEKGVYIIDSTGTKLIKHEEVKSITEKKFDAGNSFLLILGIGVVTSLILIYNILVHLKFS